MRFLNKNNPHEELVFAVGLVALLVGALVFDLDKIGLILFIVGVVLITFAEDVAGVFKKR